MALMTLLFGCMYNPITKYEIYIYFGVYTFCCHSIIYLFKLWLWLCKKRKKMLALTSFAQLFKNLSEYSLNLCSQIVALN